MAASSSASSPPAPPPSGDARKLLVDVTRGLCGGSLFGAPLIYTMEMWQLGYDTPTFRTILYLGVAYVFLFGMNVLSGFREEHGLFADLGDAVVSLAIGLVVSAICLTALAEITSDNAPLVALREVILLAIPVSLGVSLARSQLSAGEEPEDTPGHVLAHRLGVTFAGALVLGMSAAPTEEIRLIASRSEWWHLLAMTVLAVGLAWATLFVAAFPGEGLRRRHDSHFGEAVMVHAVGLVVAAMLLAAFAFFGGDRSAAEVLASVVALGLPATIGAAAGRLTL